MPRSPEGAQRILLTGASGYVGGRLLRALEERGTPVRCLARHPGFLRGRAGPDTEVVQGDVLDASSLGPAMRGIDTAYYLVHSMGSAGDFEREDRRAARLFGEAAKAAGVRRLVYLGGLGSGSALSAHLRSRHEVGEILRASGVPTIELRASIVIGSGSLSFEMIRALTEKLPVMITPRWVRVPAQPIAIEDVIAYLLAARELPGTESTVYEIGGADRVSYGEIMREYARQRGLRRMMIPVPVLSPRLSGLWLGLVTPIYARVGRKLVDSLRNPTVVHDERALSAFAIRPRGIADAIARALQNEDRVVAETRWSDALSSAGAGRQWGGKRFGSRLVDSRSTDVAVAPADAFAPIRRLGGATGWYYGDWLWRVRGFLDLLVGGVGVRRGRRNPEQVEPGDTVDFWRVERVEPNRLLSLTAEMRLPGRAWLQFEVEPSESGSRVRQTAIFDPVGLLGLLYWYALYPLHTLVFEGMLRGIARAANSAPAAALPTTRAHSRGGNH
ncbi:MAG: SDR family oxidoreductase [Gemmatimonadota bacterium]|nr:MAG: SDR family oxidoreductase [Gemmatimonadota bacterium]